MTGRGRARAASLVQPDAATLARRPSSDAPPPGAAGLSASFAQVALGARRPDSSGLPGAHDGHPGLEKCQREGQFNEAATKNSRFFTSGYSHLK